MTTENTTEFGSADSIPAVRNLRAKPVINPELEMLKKKQREGNENEKRVIDFLFEYESVMASKKEHGEEGAKMQSRLNRILTDIVETMSAQDFRSCWSIVLLFAKLHRKSSFGSEMINRYSHLWSGTEQKLTGFQMLVNVILLTADPENRARNVRRQIDFSKSLEKYFSAEGAQRVVGYYKS